MKSLYRITIFYIGIIILISCHDKQIIRERKVWTISQAKDWQTRTGWLCGSDFIPSTAVNQLEMWQSETFDTLTINKELGWAEGLGMNVMRVFLHHLAWEQDKDGFKYRINTFLDIASRHHIKIMFVFFDDCWNPQPKAGKQPDPVPGRHNSGWDQDPGRPMNNDTALFPELENYVKDIMNTFAADKRIVIWDLYNEPNGSNNSSLRLLKSVYHWAKQTKAEQPVTSAIHDYALKDYNNFRFINSDIISYHNYEDSVSQKKEIDSLRLYGRPLICSEYMARPRNSTFGSILPLLRRENVGAINWGLVSGKTNTIYAWGDSTHMDGSEPALWFHDIFRKNGMPYSQEETGVIKRVTKK